MIIDKPHVYQQIVYISLGKTNVLKFDENVQLPASYRKDT